MPSGWKIFKDRATIGHTGSESGLIIRDIEHPSGARMTLEKFGKIAPYSITCGIYGWMVHTRFFATETEASQNFDLMAQELSRILSAAHSEELVQAIGRFVEDYP